MKMEMKDNS